MLLSACALVMECGSDTALASSCCTAPPVEAVDFAVAPIEPPTLDEESPMKLLEGSGGGTLSVGADDPIKLLGRGLRATLGGTAVAPLLLRGAVVADTVPCAAAPVSLPDAGNPDDAAVSAPLIGLLWGQDTEALAFTGGLGGVGDTREPNAVCTPVLVCGLVQSTPLEPFGVLPLFPLPSGLLLATWISFPFCAAKSLNVVGEAPGPRPV
jgi:hypothetical protein